jgi:signal transduction histidine kinase/ligand-binding sensor domain-containing protein
VARGLTPPVGVTVSFRTTRLALLGSILAALMLCARVAAAQYHVESWTTENGLSHNIVRALQQTRDGYIWMATSDGLVRFDGVRFTVFNRVNSPGLRNNRFTSLYEAADGAIWAGTEGSGVTRYAQGVFTTYSTRDGLPSDHVSAVTGDAAGNVWVISGDRIVQWDGTRFRQAAPRGLTLPFYRSEWNPLVWWASDRERLYRFEAGQITERPIPAALQGLSNNRIEEDAAGTVWMGTLDRRIARITGSTVRYDEIPDLGAGDGQLPSALRDHTGHEWPLMVSRFLLRFWLLPGHDGPVALNSVIEDREGNIWLGTDGQGLFRIRQPRVTVYSRAQGLLAQNVYPVLTDRSGSVWMGVWPAGVTRITNGRVVNYTVADGLASGFITSLTEDRQGRVWAASHHDVNGGLRVFENGRFREVGQTLVPPHTFVHAMLHDAAGALWLGTHVGIVRYHGGVATMFTTKDGLPADDVKTIIEEPGGRVWIGTFGGVTSWQAGVFKSWTGRDGLPDGVVRALYLDRDGVLWIGTYDGGLGRYKNGRFSRFTTREGLFDNGVFQILEDQRGYFWMGSNRGIYRVSKRELNAVADGTASRVTSLSLGKGDGLLSAECNGGTWPSGAIGPNGTLWFPTQDGVAVIDPSTIAASSRAVPPRIESVLVDREPAALGAPIRIEPGQEALEIQYTGLSLVNSDRIRFRYRLTGLDHDWVDAGTRRTAYYSHVPPGDYTFTVAAAGSDGVWTNDAANLSIHVLSPFWRTWWFLTLAAAIVAGAAAFGYRRRIAGLERARAAQESFARRLIESQEHERRRIAAELHDSLGQQLIVIKNRALLGAMKNAQTGDGTRDSVKDGVKEEFDEIADSATQSIDEVRQIAYNLRPYHLDRLGLGASIEAMTERIGASSDIDFTVNIAAKAALNAAVPKDQQINVFRIIQESLNNIVKHSGATRGTIDIAEAGSDLLITIADNGKGFDAKAATAVAIASGFGLAGIAERVGMLGGRHSIVSVPGQGTTITIALKQHQASLRNLEP